MISKKRIRNGWKATAKIKEGTEFLVAIEQFNQFKSRLIELGFTKDLQPGEQILPAPLGPVSTFNAEGKYVPLKDLPKEDATREIRWTWKQWAGRGQYEEVSEVRDVPYQRYQRKFCEPPGEELTIREHGGRTFLTSRLFKRTKESEFEYIHAINLFLELFGECQLFTPELAPPISPTIKRLNWEILPEGNYPWQKIQSHVDTIIKKQPERNQEVIEYHLETITEHEPEFVAIGKGGFGGYFVFGFPKLDIFILESIYLGNATYVFGDDWQRLSQLTKADILNGQLHKERVIHRSGWKERIQQLLEQQGLNN